MAGKSTSGSGSGVFTLSEEADLDLSEIYIATAERWGLDQAEAYDEFLHEVMQKLADHPTEASLAPGRADTRVCVARWRNSKHGHRIFYREFPGGIFVIRILHTAMDWRRYLR